MLNNQTACGGVLNWNLRFVCHLSFVIWDLINFVFEKED
jgi:hypothetical protein